MTYACKMTNGLTQRNDNYKRYVGWESTDCDCTAQLFSDENIKKIKEVLYEKLKCVRSDGRPIIVSDRVITHVMSQIYENFKPQLGDIYTIFTISAAEPRDDVKRLTDLVIETIFSNITSEIQMEESNKKLTIWTTVLGDFNEHGLRQHPIIKTNARNINKMRFNMNY
jgi:hypothetical protein